MLKLTHSNLNTSKINEILHRENKEGRSVYGNDIRGAVSEIPKR